MTNDGSPSEIICSFCGKHQDEVRKIIAGPKAYICDECVDICVDVLIDQGMPSRWLLSKTWFAWWRRLNRWMVPPMTDAKR